MELDHVFVSLLILPLQFDKGELGSAKHIPLLRASDLSSSQLLYLKEGAGEQDDQSKGI